MKCCINDVNFISLLILSTELFKFEIQKYGQILCVHKPHFLMPGDWSHMPSTHIVTSLIETRRKPQTATERRTATRTTTEKETETAKQNSCMSNMKRDY